MMYVMKQSMWPNEYTNGHVYEGERTSTAKGGAIRVRNNLGVEEDISESWFRTATLEDAYNPTHYLDGRAESGVRAVSPGLEKPVKQGDVIPMDSPGIVFASPQPAKPSELQVGGDHYKKATIQPAVFAELNGLSHLEANVVKRVYRHSRGGKGREDIEKAIHELQLLLELRY